jgi:hypothetical protein
MKHTKTLKTASLHIFRKSPWNGILIVKTKEILKRNHKTLHSNYLHETKMCLIRKMNSEAQDFGLYGFCFTSRLGWAPGSTEMKEEMWVVYQCSKLLHPCVNGNRKMSTPDRLRKFSVLVSVEGKHGMDKAYYRTGLILRTKSQTTKLLFRFYFIYQPILWMLNEYVPLWFIGRLFKDFLIAHEGWFRNDELERV